jgi:hypothetical protein
VDWPLISIKSRNEIVAHGRAIVLVRFISVGGITAPPQGQTRHGPLRMVLANPTGVLTAFAFDRVSHLTCAPMAE